MTPSWGERTYTLSSRSLNGLATRGSDGGALVASIAPDIDGFHLGLRGVTQAGDPWFQSRHPFGITDVTVLEGWRPMVAGGAAWVFLPATENGTRESRARVVRLALGRDHLVGTRRDA